MWVFIRLVALSFVTAFRIPDGVLNTYMVKIRKVSRVDDDKRRVDDDKRRADDSACFSNKPRILFGYRGGRTPSIYLSVVKKQLPPTRGEVKLTGKVVLQAARS